MYWQLRFNTSRVVQIPSISRITLLEKQVEAMSFQSYQLSISVLELFLFEMMSNVFSQHSDILTFWWLLRMSLEYRLWIFTKGCVEPKLKPISDLFAQLILQQICLLLRFGVLQASQRTLKGGWVKKNLEAFTGISRGISWAVWKKEDKATVTVDVKMSHKNNLFSFEVISF